MVHRRFAGLSLCVLALGAAAIAGDDPAPVAARAVDVVDPVGVMTTIVKLTPGGRRVAKGELLCELDAAPVREALARLSGKVERAAQDLEAAEAAAEVAGIALDEYVKATYPQEREQLEGEIRLAQSEFELAKDRLDQVKPAAEAEVKRARIDLLKAEIGLRRAQIALRNLNEFSKARRVASRS